MTKKIPMRMCVGCRQMKEKRDMIRVVRTQNGEFLIDATGKMNGRGAYICRNADCLKMAVKNRGMERSFKMNIPEDVTDRLLKEMNELAQ